VKRERPEFHEFFDVERFHGLPLADGLHQVWCVQSKEPSLFVQTLCNQFRASEAAVIDWLESVLSTTAFDHLAMARPNSAV